MSTTAYRLEELAQRVRGEVRGDPRRVIRGIATLGLAEPDQLSFWTHVRYRKAAESSRAGAILVGPDSPLAGRDLLVAPRPYAALAELLELYHPPALAEPGISPDARLGERVRLGRDVSVGPFAVVEADVVLGDEVTVGAGSVLGAGCRVGPRSELRPRVVLYPGTRIGADCLVHAGVVLGADGFGFANVEGRHRKVPQVGRVVLEDEVEVGANSTVDRAMLGETRVGAGSKIDNLVMLAHGVQVGAGSLFAGQAGVAGSARLGARTTIAGQSGIAGHLEIGDGVVVAAKSAVFDDQPQGAFVAGVPAVDQRLWKKSQALARKLPEMRREIRELSARLAILEGRLEKED